MCIILWSRLQVRLCFVNLPDPLLPLPDEPLDSLEGVTPEERMKALIVSVSDHLDLHAMAWPARNAEGNLAPPPGEHVFHELAHIHDLVDEERLLSSPKLGDVYVISELPACDLCGGNARYDAVIEVNADRGGAYLCDDHYSEHGSGTLGASGDTYLMLATEVPKWVQDGCNQLLAAQGRDPLF